MKSKILIFGVVALVTIIAVFFALQKEEIKINNVSQAIELVKEKYPEFTEVIKTNKNITVENISNGWKIDINIPPNTTQKTEDKNITTIIVYKNGNIEKTEKTIFTKGLTEDRAITLIKEKYTEFKNIQKCEFKEKLMCHQDITTEKLDGKWNITFMNESKGCNNECVIEHYYSFVVDKDGKIAKDIERERTITLETILYNILSYPERMDDGWPYTRNWLEKQFFEISGACESSFLPWNGRLWGIKINQTGKIIFQDLTKRKIYVGSTANYNTLFEKFSTKTINNESDVLEAFERYLKLFGGCGYGGILTGKEEGNTDDIWEWILLAKSKYNFLLLEHKPVIVKKSGSCELNCSTWCFSNWHDVTVVRYKAEISNLGSVNILNKNESVFKDVITYKL